MKFSLRFFFAVFHLFQDHLKTSSFPHWVTLCLCLEKNQLTICVRLYFWILYSVSLIYASNFSTILYCLDYCSFKVVLKPGGISPLTLFFNIVLTILVLSPFHISNRLILKYWSKNPVWILIGTALNLWSVCGELIS